MKGLLLLAFGGPRSLDEVEPFLTRLFRGRKPSPEQLGKIKERYRLIGGFSPLPEITFKQARALENSLNSKGYEFKSYVGMRYGHPLIEEALKEILQDGIEEVLALPMAPFRSRGSTGAYIEEVARARKNLEKTLEMSFIEAWHLHPLFLEAVQEKIQEGLIQFTPEEKKKVHLIFTAHSLPKSLVENEPYVKDIEGSVGEVLKEIEPFPWHIAFQSRGMGSEEWLGPEVESVLTDLSQQNVREVLVVPIGFVSDHIEILYDIDILYCEKAKSMGMVLKRTPSLNFSEKFVKALTAIVEEHAPMVS
ncbi:MAG TPA: ferrochelatase [Thermodesulfobacteriota bacterium]|jgi:ferrochelatase|nr:ferrochelatase [Thermodesulfobacteriota bacterium]